MILPNPWPFPVYITGGKSHRIPAPVEQKPVPAPLEDALF